VFPVVRVEVLVEKQPGQQAILRGSRSFPLTLSVLSQLLLYLLPELTLDDGLVLAGEDLAAVGDLADVEMVL